MEGTTTISWIRLSCRKYRENTARLQLHDLTYTITSFIRTLNLPKDVEHWLPNTLWNKVAKIGSKAVPDERYVASQLVAVTLLRNHISENLEPDR